MKTIQHRFNNIIGQLEGSKKMLTDNERDCFAVLTQLKAVRSATASLMDKILEIEFNRCLVGSKPAGKDKIEKIIKEIIKNK